MSAANFFRGARKAAEYAAIRPKAPDSVIDELLQRVKVKSLAVDVGCGSGQVTERLAGRFERVLGIDSSPEQIAEAENTRPKNLEYLVGDEELKSVSDESVDFLSAFSSAHWFDIETFYQAASRVLTPGGVFALVCFEGRPRTRSRPELQPIIDDFFLTISEFRASKRQRLLVEGHYKELPSLPVPEVEQLSHHWVDLDRSVACLVRFIRTLSYFQAFSEAEGQKSSEVSLKELTTRLKETMGLSREIPDEDVPLTLSWFWFGRIGIKPVKAY